MYWLTTALYRQLIMASNDVQLVRNILAVKHYDKEWVRCVLWSRLPWSLLHVFNQPVVQPFAPVDNRQGDIVFAGRVYKMEPVQIVIHNYYIDGTWEEHI